MQQRRYREAEKHFDNVLALLEQSPDDEIIPVSEGVTTGALREMVENIRHSLAGKEKIVDKDIPGIRKLCKGHRKERYGGYC